MTKSNDCTKAIENGEYMTMNVLPQDREPTIRVLAMPTDTNAAGDIFGGWIMSQVDIAASIAAFRRARGRVVTVAVNSFEFHQPVFVGDLISCYAEVTRVGRTSLTIWVEVYAERNRQREECIKVTEATLTFVAVDENRKPRVVPRDENGA
jgi:acyl-CoA thioesterase YciA